jgi:hypothetical protein
MAEQPLGSLEAEIERVRTLGIDQLRPLWRTTFGSAPPPALTKDLLAPAPSPAPRGMGPGSLACGLRGTLRSIMEASEPQPEPLADRIARACTSIAGAGSPRLAAAPKARHECHEVRPLRHLD